MKKLIFALAACAVVVISCQKKEDKDPIDVSKTTFLMDGRWQLKVYTTLFDMNDSLSTPVDSYTPLAGCEKDDYLIFNTTNRVSRYQGATKCNISDPDSVIYGYQLSENDRKLWIYTDPESEIHENYLSGDISYPSIDSFTVIYTARNPQDTTKTSLIRKTYCKLPR